jgi:hypothetical protein
MYKQRFVENISDIKTDMLLICPLSADGDMIEIEPSYNFWIDENNVWNIGCYVCGDEHCIGDMEIADD